LLKIKKLYIENINNFERIELSLNDGLNIICGQNGAGKTTVLNCILSSFNRRKLGLLNVNASENHGFWEIDFFRNYELNSRVHYIHKEDEINDYRNIKGDKLINSNFIISISVNNRNMSTQYYGANPLKQWLYKNYFSSELNNSKTNNFSLVKECFSMIDPGISFYKIEEVRDERKSQRNSYYNQNNYNVELYVASNKGIININQMSSGYQSVLMILLSLVKKIESINRLGADVHNFEGVLLIDELDLYLHPEWQKRLVQIIRWLLPKAQIITTTHSPHIIQSARPGEIIPLGIDWSGSVFVRDLPDSSEFGYQGWTIEEILTDVMGLQETRSEEYINAIRNFDRALDREDVIEAEKSYKRLQNMLHPNSSSLKLLRLEMASLGGFDSDKNK